MRIHADPVQAIKTANRLKNLSLVISAAVLAVVIMFADDITGLIRDILLCLFAIFATIAAFYTTVIRNIPVGIEVMDWVKVKRLYDELSS